MPYSEAQKRASRKYKEKAYDRLEISVPKGRKDEIKAFAEREGESLNGYVVRAVDWRMEYDEEMERRAKGGE